MEFWTKLIQAKKTQTPEARKSLEENCTQVTDDIFIFEGDIECLEDDGVKFEVLDEGAVPCLGDLSKAELVELCKERFCSFDTI
jgi:hypothetical protein